MIAQVGPDSQPPESPPAAAKTAGSELELPDSTANRLGFQLEAARIQSDNAKLMADTSQIFKRLYDEPSWSEQDTAVAKARVERGRELSSQWDGLRPPEPLRHLWRRMSELMKGLNSLLDEMVALGEVPQEVRAGRALELQARFNAQLETTNGAETELLEMEKDLRIRRL